MCSFVRVAKKQKNRPNVDTVVMNMRVRKTVLTQLRELAEKERRTMAMQADMILGDYLDGKLTYAGESK